MALSVIPEAFKKLEKVLCWGAAIWGKEGEAVGAGKGAAAPAPASGGSSSSITIGSITVIQEKNIKKIYRKVLGEMIVNPFTQTDIVMDKWTKLYVEVASRLTFLCSRNS